MPTPAKKRGFVGNVYLQAGSHESPSWTQVRDAGDIKIADSWKTHEGCNRASGAIKFNRGMQDWSVEFKMIRDSSNAEQNAIRAAYRSGEPIDIWAADGPSSAASTSGLNACWLVAEFSAEAPIADGMEVTVKLLPHANCSFEPDYLNGNQQWGIGEGGGEDGGDSGASVITQSDDMMVDGIVDEEFYIDGTNFD